jgi:RNA polymerase sigma factor (sigma-70 family)
MSESVEIVTGGGNRSLEEAWTQAQAGLGYVAWLARDYLYTGVPREDLESEGRLGLLDAALRFDPAHGVQFITYASWWARRRMQLFAARHARVVRRPATRASARPIEWGEVSIDDPVGVGATRRWSDVLPDPAARPPVADLLDMEGVALLARAVGELPPLWARVVSLRFGFHDRAPMTLRAIGARLGLSRERVRQIEAKSLRRLRAIVEESWSVAS